MTPISARLDTPALPPLSPLPRDHAATAASPSRRPRLSPARARRMLAGGALAGGAGAVAFASEPQGIGLALYLGALVAGLSLAGRDPAEPMPRAVTLLLATGAGFAALLALRGAEMLAVFNAMAGLAFIMLASAFLKPGTTRALGQLRVRDLLALLPAGASEALTGAPRFLLGDARAAFARADGTVRASSALAVLRAVGLALLLLLVFMVLLAGGDPVFRSVLTLPAWWRTTAPTEAIVRFVVFACPALALLWSTTRASSVPHDPLPAGLTLNRLDVLVVLGALNALFVAYLLVQVRVLFGGSAYVLAATGLTLAQYARAGFFSLVVAAGLVLGVLLTMDALLRADRLAAWRVSRGLALSLLAMVGLMLVSAASRMLLYVQGYGITMDRILALTIMSWLAVSGGWFTLTVLRERASHFVPGSVVAGVATLGLLNAINPEALVVRSALSQAAAGRAFDREYLVRELTSDAVPLLVRALRDGAIPRQAAPVANDACAVASHLLARYSGPVPSAAGWTWSAFRARRTVQRHRAMLEAQCTP